jgi:hypothetical protein
MGSLGSVLDLTAEDIAEALEYATEESSFGVLDPLKDRISSCVETGWGKDYAKNVKLITRSVPKKTTADGHCFSDYEVDFSKIIDIVHNPHNNRIESRLAVDTLEFLDDIGCELDISAITPEDHPIHGYTFGNVAEWISDRMRFKKTRHEYDTCSSGGQLEDDVIHISEVIGELEKAFDDGETIEDKASGALSELPRTVAIRLVEEIDRGKRIFVSTLKEFMVGKPTDYVVTGGDMRAILKEIQGQAQ